MSSDGECLSSHRDRHSSRSFTASSTLHSAECHFLSFDATRENLQSSLRQLDVRSFDLLSFAHVAFESKSQLFADLPIRSFAPVEQFLPGYRWVDTVLAFGFSQ